MGQSRGGGGRAIGVRDVAARAGVSRQTVSRVLNEHPDVAPHTRERVLAAMGELGYRMNNVARALGTRRSRTIGVLAPAALHYGPLRSIETIEAAARAAGYWVSAAFADSATDDAVRAAIGHLLGQGVDGLVVVAPHADTVRALDAMDLGIPTVALHSAGRGGRAPAVDQVAGARLATACLADAGHRRIAHLAGPLDWLEAQARRDGFVQELAARGVEPGPVLAGDWTARAGFEAAAAVVGSGATAVFSANDRMALGLLGGLRERGIRVPEELSVVGFDDEPDAAYYAPALTTVRQDFAELARRAIAQLLGRPVPAEPVAPVLVSRASVAPPAS
ncbi:LacI family DNA-binding transcriptional regulator [Microbacterium sp.]|uniref:LacI family DNA-binding transcriptional regulator n=1 Tax=Microbacterium sp. TaxID=51671 RepID=UPI0039E33AF8